MSGVATGREMEEADPEVANWSEKVEDLVESGAIDSAIALLESLVLKLQPLSSAVDELQLTTVLFELAKLYDSQGLSLRADEARSRSLSIKNRSLHSSASSKPSHDVEVAREESEQVRVSIGSDGPESSCSTNEVLADDGNLDKSTKSQNADGNPGEAFTDDDWEAKADAPDELLPLQGLPDVSKISLENSVEPAPKRRGRGSFLYKKEVLYADQLEEESVTQPKFDDNAQEDSATKNSAYGTRHVLVLDGFQPSYNTRDLENIFKNFIDQSFAIRWVNDTVALAVFRSPSVALEACKSINCPFSVRVLEENDTLMGSISRKDLEPPRQRPQTSVRTAQRLIAHGMGIKIQHSFGSKELRNQEEDRKNRIVTRQKLRDDAWGPDD